MAGAEARADAVGGGGIVDRAKPVVRGSQSRCLPWPAAAWPIHARWRRPTGDRGRTSTAGETPAPTRRRRSTSTSDPGPRTGAARRCEGDWVGERGGWRRRIPAKPRSAPGPCRPAPARSGRPPMPRLDRGRAMTSLHSPALKRTTGTPVTSTTASSSAASRWWLRFSAAGEGMRLPRWTRNFYQPALVLQARDVPPDADAVHRAAAEADVVVQ